MSRKKKSPLDVPQECVEDDYAASNLLLKNKSARGDLHMFFSPWRVPIGLTDEEIAICVLLYRYRRDQMDKQVATASAALKREDYPAVVRNLQPKFLNEEFSPHKVMTRTRFKKGIYKFLVQLSQEQFSK